MFGLNDVAFLGSLQPPAQLLLDAYPNAAAAYSLRQLRTGVTNVVRVRRSSDNTEADFTAAQVSDGSLAAWVGAGSNGLVRTWYDQSGNNRNMLQTTNAQQPQIVSNGSLLLQGAQPALSFDGASNRLILSSDAGVRTGAAGTVLAVANISSFAAERCLFDIAFYRALTYGSTSLYNYYRTTKQSTASGKPGGRVSFNSYDSGSEVFVSVNANLEQLTNPTFSPTGSSGTSIGSAGASLYHNSTIQEIVFYSTSLLASRIAIESNINTHYAIY
jgi:hypothetical protein